MFHLKSKQSKQDKLKNYNYKLKNVNMYNYNQLAKESQTLNASDGDAIDDIPNNIVVPIISVLAACILGYTIYRIITILNMEASKQQ